MAIKPLGTALLLAAASLLAAPASADIFVGSWNVKRLGHKNGQDIAEMARIASAFDVIALQEVMTAEGLARLEVEIEAHTGANWESMASHAIGRGSYKEHYAFLWNPEKVSWIDGAVVYIDDRDAFAREPFSMRFESHDGYQFVLANTHLIWGDSKREREREAHALAQYHSWLADSFPDTPIYIAGDFNLPPSNRAWDALRERAAPLITKGATTLSPKGRRSANLYDNFWGPLDHSGAVMDAGIFQFPAEIGMSHKEARERVSDHAPVWALLDNPEDDLDGPGL